MFQTNDFIILYNVLFLNVAFPKQIVCRVSCMLRRLSCCVLHRMACVVRYQYQLLRVVCQLVCRLTLTPKLQTLNAKPYNSKQ